MRGRIDAFELWCWRRLLRMPWTSRRSNQSILKEISPEYSLEGLMLKLKLQHFGHLMRRTDSLKKTLMLGQCLYYNDHYVNDPCDPPLVLSLLYFSITFGRIDLSCLLETLSSLGFQNTLPLFSSCFTNGSSYSFFYLTGV